MTGVEDSDSDLLPSPAASNELSQDASVEPRGELEAPPLPLELERARHRLRTQEALDILSRLGRGLHERGVADLERMGHAQHRLGRLEEAARTFALAADRIDLRRRWWFRSQRIRQRRMGQLRLWSAAEWIESTRGRRTRSSYEQARTQLETAVNAFPESTDARRLLTYVYVRLGQLWDAKNNDEALLALVPDDTDALTSFSFTLARLDDLDAALEANSRALALATKSRLPRILSIRGYILMRLRRPDDAMGAFNRAIDLDNSYVNALVNRGITRARTGDLLGSLSDFETALSHGDDDYALHARGVSLLYLGRLEEALRSFDEAIALSPDYAQAHAHRAMTLDRLGRFAESALAHERAAKLRPHGAATDDPTDALTFANRGELRSQTRDFTGALEDLDRAKELDPLVAQSARFHEVRGYCLTRLERWQEAHEALDQALQLDPKFARGYLARARLRTRQRKFKEAIQDFDSAAEVDPEIGETSVFLTHRGFALARTGRTHEALASYELAIAKSPAFAWPQYNKALVLFELDRLEDALAAVDRALQLQAEYPQAFKLRGRIARKMKARTK